ncbi:MAG TPA: class I SAM-dependent methyltransferase [Terracidiphilus sp.]|jgi:SAM-dependent methyltransferase|nr:class I SAM-dependent methyltransferase [Terracidiphilus sp.]
MNFLPNSQASAGVVVPPAAPAASPNFDRLAPLYRWMEWFSFGPCLARCRSAFLDQLGDCRRALVLGDGDGRFTAAMLRRHATLEADAVDISPAMLRSLERSAAPHASRLRTEICDIRRWTPAPDAPAYDLVVTHFFLDCLTTGEIRALAARLRPALAPGSRWIVSEFAVPPGLFGRFVARPLIALLYRAFHLLTGLAVQRLPDYRSALEGAGFTLLRERRLLHGLLVAQMWSAVSPPSRKPA